MTIYGYARVARGRDDGTDTLQNQRLRLTGAGCQRRPYPPGHHHWDRDTETGSERPAECGADRRRPGGDRA